MGANLIDRDGSGKSQTLEGGFFVVDFTEFFVDEVIGEDAKVDDFGSDGDFFDEFGEDVWIKRRDLPLAILAETWYFSMTPGVLRVYYYSRSMGVIDSTKNNTNMIFSGYNDH